MNIGVNYTTSFKSSEGNGIKGDSKGPDVLIADSKGKISFQNIFLAQNKVGKGDPNNNLLQELKKLLEMDSDTLNEKLKQLDDNILMGLENLLSLPIDKLLQRIKSAGIRFASNPELLNESITEIRNLISEELNGEKNIVEPGTILGEENKQQDFKSAITNEMKDYNGPKVNTDFDIKHSDGNPISAELSSSDNKKQDQLEVSINNILPENDKLLKSQKKNVINIEEIDATANKDKANGAKNPVKTGSVATDFDIQLQDDDSKNGIKDTFKLLGSSDNNLELKSQDISLNNQLATGQNKINSARGQTGKNSQDSQFNDLGGQTLKQNFASAEASNTAKINIVPANDMTGVIDQISERIQVKFQSGQKQLSIQLEPESLGQVKVELKVENGEVMAKLIVESQQVKGFLEQNLDGLKSSLIKQGFNAEQIYVESSDLNYKDQFGSQQGFQHQHEQAGQEQNREELTQFSLEELESLFDEEEISQLPESIISDQRWSNLNYIRHRMNLLA